MMDFSFLLSSKKNVLTIFKKHLSSLCLVIYLKNRISLKPVGIRPGIMYVLCKVHKDIINNGSSFLPVLSAINTPSHTLVKLLLPILKSLTSNEHTVKDSFAFAEEIVVQNSDLFLESLDVDSSFVNL